ncbi:AAA family ATPase [Acidobacteriota bacterium]
MNDKIIIKNFSVLKDIEINVKKINLLIGPQSHGKSLVAKLVYFFKTINNNMHLTVIAGYGKKELNKDLRAEFTMMFPDYLIIDAPFEAVYYYDNEERFIKLSNNKSKNYKSFKIEYSKDIMKEFERCREYYKKNTQNKTLRNSDEFSRISQDIKTSFDQLINGVDQANSFFIPAGRSFFVNIEKNIFTLLDQQFSIDVMLGKFGRFLQYIKEEYYKNNPGNYLDRSIYKMCGDLLKGDYVYDSQSEYLRTKDEKRIFLAHLSSGQQEVTPLVISLMVISKFINDRFFMFIEEPETHLFPESQRIIVEILAEIYNLFKRDISFFITTHSPYILTTFNNLIQADNTYHAIVKKFEKNATDDRKRELSLKSLEKIVSSKKRLPFSDISVYLIKNGKAKSIANSENKLIDANEIDEESNRTASIFDNLLDLSYGEI